VLDLPRKNLLAEYRPPKKNGCGVGAGENEVA